jgi:hypothetical protein
MITMRTRIYSRPECSSILFYSGIGHYLAQKVRIGVSVRVRVRVRIRVKVRVG